MKKLATIIAFFFSLFSGVLPVLAFAPAARTQIRWPRSPLPPGRELTSTTQFHEFIAYIYEWGISLGGIAVFIMLVWAGIEYLTSAGDTGKMSSAKKRIQTSVTGLILLLTSWLVLNTINPQLVKLDPLPRLWPNINLPWTGIGNPDNPPPYCEFIVAYPEENFGGGHNPPRPIRFHEGQTVIRMEAENIQDGETGNFIHGFKHHSNPWVSARAFRKPTELEVEAILTADPNFIIQRYNENGVQDPNGAFVEGGLCWINIFHTTRRWLLRNPCGGILGRIQLPMMEDISNFRSDPNLVITCVEVVRRLPRRAPPPPQRAAGVERPVGAPRQPGDPRRKDDPRWPGNPPDHLPDERLSGDPRFPGDKRQKGDPFWPGDPLFPGETPPRTMLGAPREGDMPRWPGERRLKKDPRWLGDPRRDNDPFWPGDPL